jgi:hypothetical protein
LRLTDNLPDPVLYPPAFQLVAPRESAMLPLCIASPLGFEQPREFRMKKTIRKTKNFADALATEMQFAVLTKTGRVQILVKPTAKELRKRGKRGWQLFGTVDYQTDAAVVLDELIKKAISEAEPASSNSDRKERKLKASKALAKE